MAQAGLDPVAGYTPAHETSQRDTTLAREYPLALVTPVDHFFLNSIFANVPRQQRRSGAATLLIHPDDAAPRALRRGTRCASPTLGVVPRLRRRERPRSPGGGRQHQGTLAGESKGGATINATVDERDSDMGGGAVYHDNRVRVDKS